MRSCLVIDDSSVIRKVTSRILCRFDFSVEGVGSADEALEFVQGEMPLLVLVAGTIAQVPAETLLRQLRAIPGGAEMTILAMLVESNLGQMTRMKRAGADGFVFKPFNRASLARWIDPYLRDKQAA